MRRAMTPHRYRLPAAGLLVLALLACGDGGLEPEDVIGTYHLVEYLGGALPSVFGAEPPTDPGSPRTAPQCLIMLEAGTIELRRGADYTQVWSTHTTCQDGRDISEDRRVDGTWRIVEDRLRLHQPLEGGEHHEWVAYLRGERLELEVVILRTTEHFPDPGQNTPADTLFIVYRRS